MCSAPGDVYGTKVVLYGCDGRVQSVQNMPAQGFIYPSQNEPVATPENATAASNEVSQALVGKQITIRGKFSLLSKFGPYVVPENQQEVYLISKRSFTWGKPYSEMDGKLVEATGTLRFHHARPVEPTNRPEAHAPDFFYFQMETTQVRLINP